MLNDGNYNLESQLVTIPRAEIDQEDYMGRTALSWAAQRGDINAMQVILMKGADPNKADKAGKTPLTHCNNDNRHLRILLEAGAHVNHPDKINHTKLHYTIMQRGSIDSIELLFRFGADLNCRIGFDGDRPLHLSIKYVVPVITNWLLKKDRYKRSRLERGHSTLSCGWQLWKWSLNEWKEAAPERRRLQAQKCLARGTPPLSCTFRKFNHDGMGTEDELDWLKRV